MRGAFGETDLETGKIRINRKKHFNAKYKAVPVRDPRKALALTVRHELDHFKHPRKTEKAVRKTESRARKNMTTQEQKRLLAKLH